MFIDPLVDVKFQTDFPSTEPYCVLVARIDPDGKLVDALPGYTRPTEDNVYHSHVVAGALAPRASRKQAASPGRYLLAYFDILGFKQKLKTNPLAEVHKSYLELLEEAVLPQKASWTKSVAVSSRGKLLPALAWAPIEVAYASDSIILFARYDPQLTEEFFKRASMLFCAAIRCGVPLRGVVAFGDAVFDGTRNVFIGDPLIEASSLEQRLECIAVALGRSIQKIPVPPHLVQQIQPPIKAGGADLFGGLVLDWPRVWRSLFETPVTEFISEMSKSTSDLRLLARYEHAEEFFHYSKEHENWCLREGEQMITSADVWRAFGSKTP
jgi:hypothetical protein